MNILNGTDNLLYNLNRNQQDLGNIVSKLSSGLRIQSAADDPSGLAISETLQTRVGGLQQAVENVQTGGNLLTVADGAATTIQQILQRIDSLIIESNSDINSDEQLSNIQTEIDQLLLEVNHVASTANFNGVKLFDGSHDTYVANPNANVQVFQINPGLLPDGSTPTGDTVSNPQLAPGYTAQLIDNTASVPLQENAGSAFVQSLLVVEVTGYSNNPSDPVTGPLGQPGVYLQQVLYSGNTQGFANGNGNEAVILNAIPTNAGYNGGAGFGNPGQIIFPSGTNDININYQNLTQNDVGTAIAFELLLPQKSGGGTALNINDGGQEGSTIAISLPTLNTNALQISDISVLRPTQVDAEMGTGLPTGVDSSNQYAAMDAQFRVENALDQISQVRAQLGAQMVSTQEDSNNDNVNIINLTASESSIRDLDVGATTTEYTKEQILTQVGTSVLSQYQVDARQLASLMINALVA